MMFETFEKYLEACDEIMIATYGVGVEDIADYTWRDAYKDEVEPAIAIEDAIAYDGTW